MLTTEELLARINANHQTIVANHQQQAKAGEAMMSKFTELEQMVATLKAANFGGRARGHTWGAQVSVSDGYKGFVAAGCRGSARIPITASIGYETGTLGIVPVDQQREIVGLPQQRMTIRRLLAPGRTGSDLVKFVRQVSRDNAAAPVAPGETKPESSLVFELAEAPVRTIAHWIPVARQTMDDAEGLAALIDSEMRFGLAKAEEEQVLFGDGTGENLHGLVPQAVAFNPPFAIEQMNMLDELLLAVAQAQQSHIPATGIVINDLDWKRMQAAKDGEGRYLGSGPFGAQPNVAWTLPVIDTASMPQGEFLVGGFGLAAQLLDRMDVEVLVSAEDRDNFIKNMLTVRAEERVALAVKRPEAIVAGAFTVSS
jgi:HK97 family phage major capsid protein